MQDGFDVAMFGDPFMENVKEKQEKEYNRLLKKHSDFIQEQLTKAREEAVKEYITWITKGLQVEESDSNWWSYKEYLKSLKDKK